MNGHALYFCISREYQKQKTNVKLYLIVRLLKNNRVQYVCVFLDSNELFFMQKYHIERKSIWYFNKNRDNDGD